MQLNTRSWTIQRKDVDGFFGSYFESDFVKIEYKDNEIRPDQVVSNAKLSKKFKLKILIGDELIEYYFTSGVIPSNHSAVRISEQKDAPFLVLKKPLESIPENIEIEVNADLRLSAVVSLIKAGFLTLFEMLGYRYSMSPGGKFIGHDVLGTFYKNNKNIKDKATILLNARKFFEKYVNLVRPVDNMPIDINGTCKDKKFFLCINNGSVWGCIVFIKISEALHAVLLPLFENQVGKTVFHNFLISPGDITAKLGTFNGASWVLSKQNHKMFWPNNDASLYN